MKRQELLESREYWMSEIQNDLYSIVEQYLTENKLSRKDFADQLGVTKGYISQVLNGDFDHKISKLVDLCLAAEKIPILKFVDKKQFIENDRCNLKYDVWASYPLQQISVNKHTTYLDTISTTHSQIFDLTLSTQ